MVEDEFALDEDLAEEPSKGGSGKRNFLMGLALGALVGAGVALLFAPDRGENTRKRLGKRLRRFRDQSGERVAELKDRLSRELSRVKKQVS